MTLNDFITQHDNKSAIVKPGGEITGTKEREGVKKSL